jgi:hypothetical protein
LLYYYWPMGISHFLEAATQEPLKEYLESFWLEAAPSLLADSSTLWQELKKQLTEATKHICYFRACSPSRFAEHFGFGNAALKLGDHIANYDSYRLEQRSGTPDFVPALVVRPMRMLSRETLAGAELDDVIPRTREMEQDQAGGVRSYRLIGSAETTGLLEITTAGSYMCNQRTALWLE